MILESILLTAFALFALFNWLAITSLRDQLLAKNRLMRYYQSKARQLQRERERLEQRLHETQHPRVGPLTGERKPGRRPVGRKNRCRR